MYVQHIRYFNSILVALNDFKVLASVVFLNLRRAEKAQPEKRIGKKY